jgi:hypothetical protein
VFALRIAHECGKSTASVGVRTTGSCSGAQETESKAGKTARARSAGDESTPTRAAAARSDACAREHGSYWPPSDDWFRRVDALTATSNSFGDEVECPDRRCRMPMREILCIGAGCRRPLRTCRQLFQPVDHASSRLCTARGDCEHLRNAECADGRGITRIIRDIPRLSAFSALNSCSL